mmetsp:Transcript_31770/g.61206  ORF Transcript_31770/g.61206 Transcript_31770/m.61206 type:complete len:209 (-) Transcript_31770:913-1539(-)
MLFACCMPIMLFCCCIIGLCMLFCNIPPMICCAPPASTPPKWLAELLREGWYMSETLLLRDFSIPPWRSIPDSRPSSSSCSFVTCVKSWLITTSFESTIAFVLLCLHHTMVRAWVLLIEPTMGVGIMSSAMAVRVGSKAATSIAYATRGMSISSISSWSPGVWRSFALKIRKSNCMSPSSSGCLKSSIALSTVSTVVGSAPIFFRDAS